MKKVSSVLLLLLASLISVAQNSILGGKITDENNQPVYGAIVRLHKGDIEILAKTDSDGLYYTEAFKPGKYEVTVTANNKIHIAKEITVPPASKEMQYYNFSLKGEKATIAITDKNPFMAAKFQKMASEDPMKDVLFGKPGSEYIIKIKSDSASKAKENNNAAKGK